jgi:hypothetical protein
MMGEDHAREISSARTHGDRARTPGRGEPRDEFIHHGEGRSCAPDAGMSLNGPAAGRVRRLQCIPANSLPTLHGGRGRPMGFCMGWFPPLRRDRGRVRQRPQTTRAASWQVRWAVPHLEGSLPMALRPPPNPELSKLRSDWAGVDPSSALIPPSGPPQGAAADANGSRPGEPK